eukprot:gnl/Hemi2/17045_TR5670_c0_g1_i1.p1 gnl/Hemi2/17045_TR5670_c0_g1~~gnl/Hemi2/17045_TR5670_c0_g1_i1.p1  ORF type:complete len:137 (-),score=32.90 gnl/Hemi2/17045_TR5670_c0_g1_i1:83-493(-)
MGCEESRKADDKQDEGKTPLQTENGQPHEEEDAYLAEDLMQGEDPDKVATRELARKARVEKEQAASARKAAVEQEYKERISALGKLKTSVSRERAPFAPPPLEIRRPSVMDRLTSATQQIADDRKARKQLVVGEAV